MTKEEISKLVAESPFVDWFNTREAAFVNPEAKIDIPLKGIVRIWEFLNQQIQGFDAYEQELPSEFVELKNRQSSLLTRVQRLVNNTIRGNRPDDNEWNSIRNSIQDVNKPKLLYNSPETQFLVDVYNNQRVLYESAYKFTVRASLNSLTSWNSFAGTVFAYEFASREYSQFSEQSEKERKSINAIISEFEKHLSEADKHIIHYLSESKAKVAESSKEISTYLSGKKIEYSEWFSETSKSFETFLGTANRKIREVEDLYEKKLQLAAPAVYWRRRAKRLRVHGTFWLSGLVGSTAVALSILLRVLDDVSTGTLEKIFENTGTAIKWSVIALTIISFLAYAIRTFAKLTFSSFHLARDAEEREQLTYVYLALEKQKAIDPTERHLVMQSLFSRADTGLLKDEGTPTMPGNIFDKALVNRP